MDLYYKGNGFFYYKGFQTSSKEQIFELVENFKDFAFRGDIRSDKCYKTGK